MSDLIFLVLVTSADSTAALFAFLLLLPPAGALVSPGADGGSDRVGGGIVHLLDLEALVDELDIAVRDLLDILGAGLQSDRQSLGPGMLRPIRREYQQFLGKYISCSFEIMINDIVSCITLRCTSSGSPLRHTSILSPPA